MTPRSTGPRQLAADRAAMIDQFKVLSSETWSARASRPMPSAEQRLQATEQLIRPSASLDAFNTRLAEVEKERVADVHRAA